jgi:hypothetical protein
MDATITGSVMPVLEVSLSPGDVLTAESGEHSWMTESIQLRTSTQMAGATGFLGTLKRAAPDLGVAPSCHLVLHRPASDSCRRLAKADLSGGSATGSSCEA